MPETSELWSSAMNATSGACYSLSASFLSKNVPMQLEEVIAEISYTCGATVDDLVLPDNLKSIGIRSHSCSDPIEKIYYSAYKDYLICIHCGSANSLTTPTSSDTFYPYCVNCSSLDRIHTRQ